MSRLTQEPYPQQNPLYALNLYFTGRCNLDCLYCYVNKAGWEHTTADEDVLQKSVDRLLSYPGAKKCLSFMGGEPTLEIKRIARILDYARRRAQESGVALEFAIATNGTLLTQEMIDLFEEYQLDVSVSIDGNKSQHDLNRPFRNGTGASSYDQVLQNLDKINRGSLRFGAAIVFTPEKVIQLVSNLKFLNARNFTNIDFYPDLYAYWSAQDIQRMQDAFQELTEYYVGLFQQGKSVFKNALLDKFVNEVGLDKRESCGKLHLNPEGEFYVCDKVFSLEPDQRREYVIGDARQGIDLDCRKRILSDLTAEFFAISGLGCQDCSFLPYCFCPLGHVIYLRHSQRWKTDAQKKKFFQSFCCMAKIYNKTFLEIKTALKYHPRFIELYKF